MLIFVYNADSGSINALKDYIHKEVRPSTYPCSLCGLTYGRLGMKRNWSDFIKGLDVQVQFLHIDEFEDKYPDGKGPYPTCLKEENGNLYRMITKEELDNCKDLEELKELVRRKIEKDR